MDAATKPLPLTILGYVQRDDLWQLETDNQTEYEFSFATTALLSALKFLGLPSLDYVPKDEVYPFWEDDYYPSDAIKLSFDTENKLTFFYGDTDKDAYKTVHLKTKAKSTEETPPALSNAH
jgi:hypothetical protein